MRRLGSGALLLLCWLLTAAPAANAEKRIALLIGNQGYNARVGPLKNPHNDIALIGTALRSLKFKVVEVKDADYRAVDTAIKRHSQTVRREGQGAISFVYYSGHGAADPDTKINYLIPVDVANADDDDLWINSLNLNAVIEQLRGQAPQATHYVVFDACRNELNLTSKGKRVLVDRGFQPLAYTPGVMVAYATAPGKTATDLGVGGAPYAKALAEEILKPGVEAMTMFRRVALKVNREIGQDPWISASTLPEVYFAGEAAIPPAPPAPPTQPQLGEAALAWASVKDSTDIRDIEAYRRQYGQLNPFYDRQAERRIEELKKHQLAVATPAKEPAPEPTPVPPKMGPSAPAVVEPSTAPGNLLRTLDHGWGVLSVAVSPDGRMIVSGGGDKTIKLWEVETGRLIRTLEGHGGQVGSVAVSADGRVIVSSSGDDKAIKLWQMATGRLIRSIEGKGYLTRVAVSPDSQTIVSGDLEKTIRLWDAATGRLIRTLQGHADTVWSVAVSPDGRTILSGGGYSDKTIKLWEAATGRLIRTLQGHDGAVNRVAVSPDGQMIVSGSDDRTLKLWEVTTGRLIRTFEVQAVSSIAISPDGRMIVSGGASADKTIKLWEVATGRLITTLEGHKEGAYSVAVSPDGRMIVTGGADGGGHYGSSGSVKIWAAP